jgi:cytochrome P450
MSSAQSSSRAGLPPSLSRPGFMGQFRSMHADPFAYFRAMADLGDVSYVKLGRQRLFLLNHPDLVRELLVAQNASLEKGRALDRAKVLLGDGLVTSKEPMHAQQRRLIQPAFHRQRIQGYGASMAAHAAKRSQAWHSGQVVDVMTEMSQLTLGIATETLFGATAEGEALALGRALNDILLEFEVISLPFGDLWRFLPTRKAFKFWRGLNRLNRYIYRMIETRRQDPQAQERSDLLTLLILAEDAEDERKRMGPRQVRDEAMTLFVAGHETTSTALAWAWWLLSQSPEAEAAVHAELDAVLGGRVPGPDDVPRLKACEALFAEALRLQPPVWIVGRRALKDLQLGGYEVPRGSILLASQWLMHRDARFWSDPLRLDLGRWSDEAKAQRHPFAYFPFGAGPRGCIGEGFAWMEGILCLATLASRWRLRPLNPERATPMALITLRPQPGLSFRLEAR